jgi:hypothetical protein
MGGAVSELRLSIVSVRHLLVGLTFVLALSGCEKQAAAGGPASKPKAPALEAIATTREVMLAMTIPSSDAIFQVGSAVPKDDAEWEKVQAHAAVLGESGNLLMLPPRAVDTAEWASFSRALIASAKVAQQAAQKRDVEGLLEAGNQIYEVCDGCHKKYMAARAGE